MASAGVNPSRLLDRYDVRDFVTARAAHEKLNLGRGVEENRHVEVLATVNVAGEPVGRSFIFVFHYPAAAPEAICVAVQWKVAATSEPPRVNAPTLKPVDVTAPLNQGTDTLLDGCDRTVTFTMGATLKRLLGKVTLT